MNEERYKILAVDDQKQNRLIIEHRLKDDYDVVFKENGYDAVTYLKENMVDLILLDVSMPDMSGHEVCRIVKSDERLKDVPIIFLSAQSKPEEVSVGFEVGGNDYVVKPFNVVELKARIKSQLKAASAKTIGMQNERLRTVGTMIASLNHEINNPLAILAGYIHTIKKNGIKNENDFDVMEDAIHRISGILKKISGLHRVDFKAYGNNDKIQILEFPKKRD